MAKPYKITSEIKQFIIEKKRLNPKLSCRGLIPLIREHFQVSISKSLINRVIKENNLSSSVGKRREKEPVIVQKPIIVDKKPEEFIENGGCFFLKAANLKLLLTKKIADNLLGVFTNLSSEIMQYILEALIFTPLFRNEKDLWVFNGKIIPQKMIDQFTVQLAKVPFSELNRGFNKTVTLHNTNDINELRQEWLQQLSFYVQVNFFPQAYQFLDLAAMKERFYSLCARVKRQDRLLAIQFFYPRGFPWQNDMVWQEDLAYAANRLNMARIFNPEKEQLQINPQVQILSISPTD